MVLPVASVQELLDKLPPLVSEVNVTSPVGAVPPGTVSVTTAVQDAAWPMATVLGEQVRTVVVGSSGGAVGFAIMARAKDEPRLSMPNTCEPDQ